MWNKTAIRRPAVFAFFCLFCVPLSRRGCGEEASRERPAPLPYMVKVAGGASQHIGKFRPTETLCRKFDLFNGTSDTLAVTNIQRSCLCDAVMGPAQKTFKPGEMITIEVRIASKNLQRKTWGKGAIAVSFDKHPTVTISFVYDIDADIVVEPDSLVDLQIRREELKKGGRIVATALDGRKFAVTSATSRNGLISVEGIEAAGGNRIVIRYVFQTTPPGTYEGTLTIETDSEINPVIEVPFRWRVEPDLEIVPAMVVWKQPASSEAPSKTCVLRSTARKGLRVLATTYNRDILELRMLAGGDGKSERVNFEIRLRPDAWKDRGAKNPLWTENVSFVTNEGTITLRNVMLSSK